MTRLRFLLVSLFSAVGAALGLRRPDRSRERIQAHLDGMAPYSREELSATVNTRTVYFHQPAFPQFGYVITYRRNP